MGSLLSGVKGVVSGYVGSSSSSSSSASAAGGMSSAASGAGALSSSPSMMKAMMSGNGAGLSSSSSSGLADGTRPPIEFGAVCAATRQWDVCRKDDWPEISKKASFKNEANELA